MSCSKRSSSAAFTVGALLLLGLFDRGYAATSATTSTATTSAPIAETFVFGVDLLAGESGYFNVEGYEGVQPALTMVR